MSDVPYPVGTRLHVEFDCVVDSVINHDGTPSEYGGYRQIRSDKTGRFHTIWAEAKADFSVLHDDVNIGDIWQSYQFGADGHVYVVTSNAAGETAFRNVNSRVEYEIGHYFRQVNKPGKIKRLFTLSK